ncbi:Arylsulfatase [hydrothermal vent metagenome]|uniref:Arylsulfatase n=1 Tax=hydrothermal vent metagenome TaxID=652676 RepID=A0A3B1CFS9_9ZZZZ
MKRIILPFIILIISIGCNTVEKKNKKPNIIYILADDLGYGEVGAYGQEKILTPNIDQLAKNGMMFTQHYSGSPVCAPSRCVLLTGKHTGHAYIRGNDEWKERGDVWDYAKASADPNLEGQRPIPASTITIGKLLQKAGYKTGIFGKWGLGAPLSEGRPNLQGFDYFYGYNCQRQAHNLYPPHLWENEKKVILNNELVIPNTKLDKGADPYDEKSYARFQQKDYAPEKIHRKALAFIKRNKDKPFFMYYATPLPHVPLQIPQKYVDKYHKLFGDEKPYLGEKGYFPTRYPRATYAAIISYLDSQVGEIISTLKKLGLYENTIVIFSSDNGPTYAGGVDYEFFNSAKPFKNGYGRTKGFAYEGGIRIPMIASWQNHIQEGSTSDHISAFYDVLPTICDIVGIDSPKDIDGISFKPTLLNKKQQNHDYLYWEFPSYKGQQAVRMDKWKGIRKNIFEGNMDIELYDLEKDIKEENNVADQNPDVVQKINEIMKQAHTPSVIKRFQFKELGD